MAPPNAKKFFFVHVMKTGGTSFADHLRDNFAVSEQYPAACVAPDADLIRRMEAYINVPTIVADVNALEGQLRVVRGHVPYAVRSLLVGEYEVLTILRDPVDRTLSYLKHCRRYHVEHLEMALEEIYEDTWFNANFLRNYQTKIFSMSADEAVAENRFPDESPRLPPRREIGDGRSLSAELISFLEQSPNRFLWECLAASTAVIDIDEDRLAIARKNLSAIDVVGVTEDYDRFLTQLDHRYGWKIKSTPRRHVGENDAIPSAFKSRIAMDNSFDMELYEYARSLAV